MSVVRWLLIVTVVDSSGVGVGCAFTRETVGKKFEGKCR